MKLILLLIFVLGCSTQYINKRTHKNTEIEMLKEQILSLQGTIAQIDSFVAGDFSNCAEGLPAFETKICQIAQTATAEQAAMFAGQLQSVTKIFQEELYGPDCMDTTTIGCPVSGSILERVTTVEAGTGPVDLSGIQADILQLQSDVAALDSRLNDFDGSGLSVEAVINAVESDITSIESRLDTLEGTLANGDVYKTVQICGDVASSGPIYEAALVTGDNTTIVAYIKASGKSGLGVVGEAGILGDSFTSTTLNTKRCDFKIYDLTTTLKICWKNDDRKPAEVDIDTECDSGNSFANPTALCTCAN